MRNGSLESPAAASSPNQTSASLDPEMTDEVLLAVEHAFLPEFVAGVNLTWRNVSDIKETRAFVRGADGIVRTARRSDYVIDRVLTGTLPDGTAYAVPTYALDPSLGFTGGTLLLNGDREREYLGLNLNGTEHVLEVGQRIALASEHVGGDVEAPRPLRRHLVHAVDVELPGSTANFLRETLSPRVWRISARINWR